MTLGLFSDAHANLPALEAVIDDLDRRRPDMLFCLGDLVGYAPWPNEVTRSVRDRRIPTIAGNYDVGVGLNSSDCGCAYRDESERARGDQSIAFTNDVVKDDVRTYLRGLPRHLRLTFGHGDDALSILMVHGSPRKINEYLFEDRPDRSLLRMMEHSGADVMLFGHTHKPYHRVLSYDVDGETRHRHAVNIGSVGKPKDGDPRSCYVMLHVKDDPAASDPESVRPEFVRVAYDVNRAAEAVEQSPLPDYFAQALREAR